tara:strand:- start:557 stop:844 length:288 start_codon:yes stop_codon:yes gene_type:complete
MKFDHIAFCVDDIVSAVEWYKDRFNAAVEYQDESWAMLSLGNIKLALTLKKDHPPHIAFVVESFNENDKTAFHRDGSEYVYRKDLFGNIIELIKY